LHSRQATCADVEPDEPHVRFLNQLSEPATTVHRARRQCTANRLKAKQKE